MKANQLAISIALALALPTTAEVRAAELPEAEGSVQVRAAGGYLGVLLGPVPDAVRTQIGEVLPPGQGVLVREVTDDSPAATAGLQAYDILLSYDDQKLFSVDQLRRLIQADGPKKTVTLRVVRAGATNDIQVTLGEAQAQSQSEHAARAIPWMPTPRHGFSPNPQPGASAENWENFDSLSLRRLEDGRFKAEIQYLGTDGRVVKDEFTGTRGEIRKQVIKEQDLPPIERKQLLDALSGRDDFSGPGDWYVPHFYVPPWFYWQPSY